MNDFIAKPNISSNNLLCINKIVPILVKHIRHRGSLLKVISGQVVLWLNQLFTQEVKVWTQRGRAVHKDLLIDNAKHLGAVAACKVAGKDNMLGVVK